MDFRYSARGSWPTDTGTVADQARAQEFTAFYQHLSDLDILATTVLTLLYSSEHAEFQTSKDVRLEALNDPQRKLAAQSKISGKAVPTDSGKIVDKLVQQGKGQVLTALEQAARMSAQKWETNEAPPNLNARIFNKQSEASEINYDTAAVCRLDDELVVALNYKNRITGEVGLPPVSTLTFVAESLFALIDQDRSARISTLWFLRPELKGLVDRWQQSATFPAGRIATKKTNEDLNAAPHAEMQLIAYLSEIGAFTSRAKLEFGISKPACEPCSTVLSARSKIAYTKWDDFLADKEVKNWVHPIVIEFIEAVPVMSRKAIATLIPPRDGSS